MEGCQNDLRYYHHNAQNEDHDHVLPLKAVFINSDESDELLKEGLSILVNARSGHTSLSLLCFPLESKPQVLEELKGEVDVKHQEAEQSKQLVRFWRRSERLRCQFRDHPSVRHVRKDEGIVDHEIVVGIVHSPVDSENANLRQEFFFIFSCS